MRHRAELGLLLALSFTVAAPLLARELLGPKTAEKNAGPASKEKPAQTARRRDSDEDEIPKVSRLPIRITHLQNEGLKAQPEKYDNPEFREACYLLTINGIALAGKSDEDINKLIYGSVGETARLGILNSDMEYKEFPFAYEMVRCRQWTPTRMKYLRGSLYAYDGSNGPHYGYSRGDEFELSNLPIYTRAWAEQHVVDTLDSPATTSAVIDSAVTASALNLLHSGDLNHAKPLVRMLTQSPLVDRENRRRDVDAYAKLLPMLDLWGLNSEAVDIGIKVTAEPIPAESAENERFYDSNNNRLQTAIALSKVLKSDVNPAFEKIAQSFGAKKLYGSANQKWLAEYYAKVGKYDEAISLYERALAEFEKPSYLGAPKKDLNRARQQAYLLVRLAQLAGKRGSGADAYLARAAAAYRSVFSNDELALIERIPGFGPTLSQIEKATSEKGANLLADLKPPQVLTDPSDLDRDFAATAVAAYASLDKADYISVQKATNSLLKIFAHESGRPDFPRPATNMFCAIYVLAEQLADRGQGEQACKLLAQLKAQDRFHDASDASSFFIDLEKILANSKSNEADWKALFDSWHSGYEDYEGLRGLASLYLTAGDTRRSSILLERAIKLCKAGTDKNQARDIALFYLNKAWLEASQSHFAEAQDYFKQSINTVDEVKVSGVSRDLDLFNRQFSFIAVRLAQSYRMKSKPALAEDTLKQVIDRIESGKSWLGVFEQGRGNSPDRSTPELLYNYGRQLADKGDYIGARPYLDKAIAATKNNVPGPWNLVRAKVAEAQKDYACAALDYSIVSQDGFDQTLKLQTLMQPDAKESYCRLALDCALKADNLGPGELGKIYMRLAEALRPGKMQEQLTLYNKAFALIVDNREKQQLAIKIANLSTQQDALATVAAGGKATVDPTAAFKMREVAARLAEKNNPGQAAQLWLQLAGSEIGAKQFDQGIAHLKTAIALLRKPPANFGLYTIEFFGLSSPSLNLLARSERMPDAVAIGNLMLDKAAELCGKQSPEYRQCLVTLFYIYAQHKDFKTADRYLDQYLAIDPRKYELGRAATSRFGLYENFVYGLVAAPETREYGMTVLHKVLAHNIRTYGSDDAHTMEVLTAIGKAETAANRFDEAEKYLKRALVISRLYGSAYSFGASHGVVAAMHNLLAAQKKSDELRQLESQIEADRKEETKNWNIPENATFDAKQKFYDYWHTRAPYNHRTLDTGFKLLESAVKAKDWARVKVLAPECIEMLAHNSLNVVGGCTPSPSPATRKFYCFNYLIHAYLVTGERQHALNWGKRAHAEKSYNPTTEEYLFLSEVDNACGNNEQALKLCRDAESVLPEPSGWMARGPVEAQFKKLQSAPDIERVQLQNQAEQLIRYEEEMRKSELERQRKNAEINASKRMPAEAIATASGKKLKAGDKDDQNEWEAEPADTFLLEPVREVKGTYNFNYAALASSNLYLANGAYIKQRKTRHPVPAYSFAAGFENIACNQPLHKAGKLSFLYDGAKGSLRSKVVIDPVAESTSGPGGPGGVGGTSGPGGPGGVGGTAGPGGPGGGGGAFAPGRPGGGGWFGGYNDMAPVFTEAPEVMALPFLPALSAPSGCTALDGSSLILKSGDYIADKLKVGRIVLPQAGRVRIFVKDNSAGNQKKGVKANKVPPFGDCENWKGVTAFGTAPGAYVNKGGPWDEFQQRAMLEIWYDGTDTITLGEGTKFTGVIYAPNATIRLEKGTEFLGAMVAKTIYAGVDSTIMYLPSLRSWKKD